MKCPLCNIDMRVDDKGIHVENDNSPELPTCVYSEQSLTCINPQCKNNGKEVDVLRHILYKQLN